jgi:hypothetical protein
VPPIDPRRAALFSPRVSVGYDTRLIEHGIFAMLAYIDPGSGSFILQAIIATLAGTLVAVNIYWQKIKRFLGLSRDGDDEQERSESSSPRDE